MFKVIRMTPMAIVSSLPIVNFEHVIAGWDPVPTMPPMGSLV